MPEVTKCDMIIYMDASVISAAIFFAATCVFSCYSKPHVVCPSHSRLLLIGAHLIVCNRSWHLPGNPELMWHPARLKKEGGCVDLSMDTLHLKYPLVLFGYEGSALTLSFSFFT